MKEPNGGETRNENDGFLFENLRVYKRALELSINLTKVSIKLPYIYSRIRDQIIGAAISIPLNLAEGSGRISDKDKKNFYRMARASAFELVPLLDIIYELGLISREGRAVSRKEISEISRIIAALMKNAS